MRYRNEREADYGDLVVVLGPKTGKPLTVGILSRGPRGGGHPTVMPANSHMAIAVSLCNCVHVDDVGRLIEAAWPLVQPMVSSTPNEDSHATDRP